ncbi:hypothetical protein [Symbiobacterium thermophilum]|uniref:SHOCT domain-containing protein n=1 Tax=Symbiobacterium thermophilum TaxID=2734 RepID=A0A953ID56_SYMTR|nr:hypothetical protein [Symbiobacterium thermophilum]MBY6276100.1 hypothetical protein [Symbiobacterium thermophilum]
MKEVLQWPNWAILATFIAVVISLVLNIVLYQRVQALYSKFGAQALPFRNRDELEAAFQAGTIDRAEYEQLKRKIS